MNRHSSCPGESRESRSEKIQESEESIAKRGPLTSDQQTLATRYLPLARSLAKPLKQAWPAECQEFESAACLALVEAAQSFDPERNVKFATYARHRIWGALRDVQRGLITSGWRNDLQNAPSFVALIVGAEDHGFVMASEPERSVGEELELAEVLDSWLKKLPKRYAETCREIYLNQKTQGEAGQSMGVSKSRVSYLHREALVILNEIWKYQFDSEDFRKL